MMDYVSNKNGTIAREKGTDHASVLLAYDMLLTATRNNKKKSGKEKEKHAVRIALNVCTTRIL